ncbi:MAG: preprotein translocase subunit SecA, partial [Bacteroidales bacterium]|nr:preprotein translocase subunit SecA [Bacteroidales bacterium]
MGFNKIIGSLFGSKADRDMKVVQPYLEKVLAVEPEIITLSNDGLRERAQNLKAGIQEFIKEDKTEINKLKEKAEALDIWEREDIFNEIDKIEERIDEKLENHLLTILPEAFAIVKDTARRFKENQKIEVSASEFDQSLATA